MTTSYHLVTPRDPLVARDGRPFGSESGNRMHCLDWPLPATLAGAVRTILGKQAGGRFEAEQIRELLENSANGPLPSFGNELSFPVPKDFVSSAKHGVFSIKPKSLRGTNLVDRVMPALMENPPEEDFKTDSGSGFWPLDATMKWLLEESAGFVAPKALRCEPDLRTHVAIEAGSGAAEDEMLFQTSGLAFPDQLSLAVRVESSSEFPKGPFLHPVGGERRLCHWSAQQPAGWVCPQCLADRLPKASRLRMILATPAIFANGWRPGWLGADGTGQIPNSETRVRLVSAIVPRWQPVSGWSYEKKGQKPVRRMVAAGSVYFLEILDDSPRLDPGLWLSPVSDCPQDQRDGFGLAIWGLWKE